MLRNLDAKKFQFFLTQKSPKSIKNAFMRLPAKDQFCTSEESFLLFYAELVEVRVGEMKLYGDKKFKLFNTRSYEAFSIHGD